MRLLAILALCAAPALADVDAALDGHVLPRIEAMAAAAETLAETPCEPAALAAAFHDAADAWAGAAHLSLGPAEEAGRGRALFFFPDERDATARGLRRLVQQGEAAWQPEVIARGSVAARGLAGLERLIVEAGGAPCGLTRALALDHAETARRIADGWGPFAVLMREAGAPGNTRFLDEDEARAALFTALVTGLRYNAGTRLERPMGTFERPRPLRAEMRRSARSVRNLTLSLEALRELAASLADAPRTQAALERAIALSGRLGDPALADVETPGGRIRVEAVLTAVEEAGRAASEEIGSALGISAGFNSLDGD